MGHLRKMILDCRKLKGKIQFLAVFACLQFCQRKSTQIFSELASENLSPCQIDWSPDDPGWGRPLRDFWKLEIGGGTGESSAPPAVHGRI